MKVAHLSETPICSCISASPYRQVKQRLQVWMHRTKRYGRNQKNLVGMIGNGDFGTRGFLLQLH